MDLNITKYKKFINGFKFLTYLKKLLLVSLGVSKSIYNYLLKYSFLFQLYICVRPDLLHKFQLRHETTYCNWFNIEVDVRIWLCFINPDVKNICKNVKTMPFFSLNFFLWNIERFFIKTWYSYQHVMGLLLFF